MHTHFPYQANGWADDVQIWCVARDPLVKSFTQVRDGMHLHVRTCTALFHILRTVWMIVLKFGVWPGTHSMSLTQVRCGTHLHVHTCTPLSHDGTFVVARSSPIKAPYWYVTVLFAYMCTLSGQSCQQIGPTMSSSLSLPPLGLFRLSVLFRYVVGIYGRTRLLAACHRLQGR